MNDLSQNNCQKELEFTYLERNNDNEIELTKRFCGIWLIEDCIDENIRTGGIRIWVAQTKKGKLLYYWNHEVSGMGGYTVYDDFDELEKNKSIGPNILSAVAYELGIEYSEYLDI